MRVGKKPSKKLRVKGKKAQHMMPGMDEMKAGMMEADEMAAMMKKRGMKKGKKKARKGKRG